MKVNLKKIGAIVAGATILASSVAFAGLAYGNTPLVNDNGQPVVKIVVGEKAAASDGVAAANIAAKIASEAFKSSALTAQLSGEATCASGEGAGSCAISDEKVTLEITAPGAATEGSYTVQSLIGDDLDRILLDRGVNTLSTSGYAYGADSTDTANPFTNGGTSKLTSSPDYTDLFKIDGGMFSPLKTLSVDDTYAGKSYTEKQNVWVNGYAYYGSSDDQVVAPVDLVAYTLQFKGATDDIGIQKCTTPVNSSLYASCTASVDSDYLTSTHKLAIKFLGEDWFVSEMSPPTDSTTSETTITPGGYVKLAKESMSGILNQGEAFDLGDVKLVLDDLEAHGDTTSAIISVQDKNGNILKKDKANAGVTKDITAGGKTYKVHVYKIAPGYTFGAKWADIAVYSHEIKLQDAYKLDPDYDSNKYWKVSLGWKNKGASSSDTTPDSLRTIIVYTSNSESLIPNSGTMRKGEFVPLIQSPVNWKLTYGGLTTVDYDNLNFKLYRAADKTSMQKVYVVSTGNWETCNLTKPYVYVTSEKDGAFTLPSFTNGAWATLSGNGNKFYVATGGVACNSTGAIGGLGAGSILMPQSSTDDAYWVLKNVSQGSFSNGLNVTYSVAGDSLTWVGGGFITVANVSMTGDSNNSIGGLMYNLSNTTSVKTDWLFALSEKAGTGESYNNVSRFVFGLDSGTSGGTDATFNYDEGTSTSKYGYNGLGSTAATYNYVKKDYVWMAPAGPRGSTGAAEEGSISDRGTKYVSTDDEQVRFSVAKQLAYAQLMLTTAEGAANPDTSTKILGEGDEFTVSGVKIKVKEITEKVGACSVGTGGAPACTVDMTGVSALIMPGDAGTATAVVPFGYSNFGPLVVLDKDAVDTDTIISVGGPMVNTKTADALSGSSTDFTATPKVVKEVVAGKKIVVAGLTASDTLEAAKDFIAALKSQ